MIRLLAWRNRRRAERDEARQWRTETLDGWPLRAVYEGDRRHIREQLQADMASYRGEVTE